MHDSDADGLVTADLRRYGWAPDQQVMQLLRSLHFSPTTGPPVAPLSKLQLIGE
jgi:hypothetical protein